jgi:hypothetical protein
VAVQSCATYLDILNVYGRENGDAFGWDERRGVNIIERLDEPLPPSDSGPNTPGREAVSRSLK